MENEFCLSPDEMIIDKRLAGGICVGQIRCSRREQASRSLPQQKAWLREFAERNGIVYVTDMTEAVSASQTKKRPDLDRIFARKAAVNDFNMVLVQDLSRLTRGGAEHGLGLYFKFKLAGIRLVSVLDGLIDGDQKIMEAARRFEEARATAKATAMNSRRGYLAARKKRRISYSFIPPFAVDRMITNQSGTQLFRLRVMRDGSQQKLSPDGNTLLHTYPPILNCESSRHVKQIDEFEQYAPGDPQDVKLVNRMYRERYVENKKAYTITKGINDDGFRSPRGKEFAVGTVGRLLLNPLYLNKAIGDRTATGQFYKNGPKYPIPHAREEVPLGEFRPESEWHFESHDLMEEFLDFDAATKARIHECQLAEARRKATRQSKKRGGSRHDGSSFILSHLLREKISKLPLIGNSNPCRRYVIAHAIRTPKSNNRLNRTFVADALEAPIRSLVGEILGGYDRIVSVARSVAEEYLAAVSPKESGLPALRAERDSVIAKIDFWIDQMKGLGPDLVALKTTPLRETVIAIGQQIECIEKEVRQINLDPEATSANLAECLEHVAGKWETIPNEAMKRILRVLVQKMEIDFETREVELVLHLPSWAASNPDVFERCLENRIRLSPTFQTPALWTIPLGSYQFLYRPPTAGGLLLLSQIEHAAA